MNKIYHAQLISKRQKQFKIPMAMKQLTPLALATAVAFFAFSCKKEVPKQSINNISTTYKAMVFEQSATWCGSCGAVGYPTLRSIASTYEHDVTIINLHSSDDITANNSPGGNQLDSYFYTGGLPVCGVNSSEAFFPDLQDLTDSINHYRAQHPKAKAGVGFAYRIEGNNMIIDTKTVVFEDITGKYNLAVYMMENNIMNTQTGQSGEIEFDHVYRAASTSSSWGSTIIASSAKAGETFEGTHTIAIPSDVRNNANLSVAVVLYKMDGNNMVDVINTNHD
jgi:hypothetical protein